MDSCRSDFVKKRFIPALRSGKFEQIEGTLCAGANFRCAEGVAVDIAMDLGALPGARWVQEGDDWFLEYAEEMTYCCLPQEVLDLLGNTIMQDPHTGEIIFYLSKANDRSLSFSEIADALEVPPPSKEKVYTAALQHEAQAQANWTATLARINEFVVEI